MEILVLPGWGQSKKNWEGNLDQLNSIAKTNAIDLPGFGKEPLTNPSWGVPEYTEWVEKYITSHKMKDVVILGHSFGGRIASFLAAKKPNWLKAIILEGAPCIYRPSTDIKAKILLYKILKYILPKKLKELFYSTDLKDSEINGLSQVFRNVVNFDQTSQLKKISVPTLLIWGENDSQVPINIMNELSSLIHSLY